VSPPSRPDTRGRWEGVGGARDGEGEGGEFRHFGGGGARVSRDQRATLGRFTASAVDDRCDTPPRRGFPRKRTSDAECVTRENEASADQTRDSHKTPGLFH